jgi:hypothetical protein
MWIHKSGYHPPHEQIATHCRKRYRLTASRNPNLNLPPPDPALWIVHYSKASQQDHIRSSSINITQLMQAQLAQRRWIMEQGQLMRKDFMLHDRNNWPNINNPPVMSGPQRLNNPYMQQRGPNTVGLMQPYPPQAPGPAAAGSRRGQPAMGHGRMPSAGMPVHVDTIDDEEDISRGDIMDFLTPREISKHRYRQMHEWMEEIWNTPFTIGQIVPVSLGLGRKGELESLTKDFFDTPVGPGDKGQVTTDGSSVGRMEPERVEEFENRANKKLAEMRGEISKMKEVHKKRMEELTATRFWREAEYRLRDAVYNPDPSNPIPEPWRLNRSNLSDEARAKLNDRETVGVVVADVETFSGRRIAVRHDYDIISKGGLIETRRSKSVELPKDNGDTDFDMSINFNGGGMMDSDMDMGNTAGSLLDQFKTSNATTPAPLLATPTPNGQESLPPSYSGSNTPAATGIAQVGPSPFGEDGTADANVKPETEDAVPQMEDMDVDVEMAGITDEPVHVEGSGAEEPGEASPGGWVMVSNDEKSGSQEPEATQTPEPAHETPMDLPTAEIQHSEAETTDNTPGLFGDTPGGGLHGLTPADHGLTPADHDHLADHVNVSADTPTLDPGHDATTFPTESDFGNIDNIEDELAGYNEQNQELDLADLDNSAFGDAFHASDAEGMDHGDGNGNGMSSGNGNGNEHEHGGDIA